MTLTLTQKEAFARIRLLRSPNVGPVSYRQLLARFGSASRALEALPDLAGRGGARYRAAPIDAVEAEIAAVRAAGARYLFHDSEHYPPLLNQLESAPPVLTISGAMEVLQRPAVAIVGARNASAAACRLAREMALALSGAGRIVVSGLARGIDTAAHRGALDGIGGAGGTIGVIASGIDITYPPENEELQREIAARGVVIAEQPPGTSPRGRHFPARNRIIAGLCAGTVVVEAAPRSGSLITARLAGEAGREVMAVPGSPLDPRAQGCNQLIRDGAILVQGAEDVIELIDGFTGAPRSSFREEAQPYGPDWDAEEGIAASAGAGGGAEEIDVLSLLSQAPVPVDEIIRRSGTGTAAVQMALLELELAGRLARHAGGRVSLSGE